MEWLQYEVYFFLLQNIFLSLVAFIFWYGFKKIKLRPTIVHRKATLRGIETQRRSFVLKISKASW